MIFLFEHITGEHLVILTYDVLQFQQNNKSWDSLILINIGFIGKCLNCMVVHIRESYISKQKQAIMFIPNTKGIVISLEPITGPFNDSTTSYSISAWTNKQDVLVLTNLWNVYAVNFTAYSTVFVAEVACGV